ncbi:hypothetical protein AB6A40_004409 [Gnathostoma spinigerum]|uniref:Solute carrier family 13 member 5 n=1 Tax=Gnathostoma spinigerum TaxID=75299 RepID=A0ABD6EN34_9BILA
MDSNNDSLTGNYLTDSSVGILVIYMMFAWPSRPLRIFHRIDPSGGSRAVQEKQRKQDDETLLTWSLVTKRFPWSVILLIGAGFAISAAVKKSCLEELVSAKFQSHLSGANHIIVQVAITSVIPIMTEFCSNTAVASIFVPIAINLARRLRLNPLYLALPSAITPSFAFMFPMATPSNAIVYSTGLLKMWEMAVCGIILDFLCLCITTVNMNTWAWWLFRLDTVVNVTGQDFNDTCSF